MSPLSRPLTRFLLLAAAVLALAGCVYEPGYYGPGYAYGPAYYGPPVVVTGGWGWGWHGGGWGWRHGWR